MLSSQEVVEEEVELEVVEVPVDIAHLFLGKALEVEVL
tara:strand:- start:361 stop:474 length:114 start_codon:yes stop_codon:yes gene_type:complete